MTRSPHPAASRSGARRAVARAVTVVAMVAALTPLALVIGTPVVHRIQEYGVAHRTVTFATRSIAAAAPTAATGPVEPDAARVTTDPVLTAPFTMIGARFGDVPAGPLLVRWHGAAGWSGWHELEVDADVGPDRASAEHRGEERRVTTEPLWVGSADGYQFETSGDAAGRSLDAMVVHPTWVREVVSAEPGDAGAEVGPGQPPIHGRSEWGARAPADPLSTATSLKLAVVHHSDTGNDYAPGDVPSILRGIQAFHIDGRGWSDIGYNFVVDKFGRIWEGRAGSIDGFVVGAHAEGFNTSSIGVMALGNYSQAAPTAPQIEAMADVISWRFASGGVDPASRVDVTSGGSVSIPAGQVVNLPRIVGHRDVGSTDCPGSYLYSQLPNLRDQVARFYPLKASPVGFIDTIAPGGRSVLVGGWAVDPDQKATSIEVHVYVDGRGTNLGPTDVDRSDVAARFEGAGTRHGFRATIGGLDPGAHSVCVFGINQGAGENQLFTCRTVTVLSGSPFGSIDVAQAGPDGSLHVAGWAVDPDSSDPTPVHVYLDGAGVNLGPASQVRSDVARTLPGYGPAHGFDWTRGGLAAGSHSVCVFGIDSVGPGANSLFGCRTVAVPTGAPFGSLDQATGLADGAALIAGWAVDPDTAAPTTVHVYVDGRGTNLGPVSANRPDIGAAYPSYGSAHGFVWVATGLAPGAHTACAFGINSAGSGGNTVLGCRRFTMPTGSPFGSVDVVAPAGAGALSVAGWAIDPDTAAPTPVHVYVDGAGINLGPASGSRPDVARAVPGYGDRHGFGWTGGGYASGAHTVCVFGIDSVGGNGNTLLGCRPVTVG